MVIIIYGWELIREGFFRFHIERQANRYAKSYFGADVWNKIMKDSKKNQNIHPTVVFLLMNNSPKSYEKNSSYMLFLHVLSADRQGLETGLYNNTDCDIYMLINQHQENGVIYPYYGELPLSIDHVDCNLQSSSWAPGRIYYILPYGTKINRGDCIHVYAFHADTLKKYSWEEIRTGKNTGFEKRYVKVLTFNFLMDLSIWKSLMQRIHDL